MTKRQKQHWSVGDIFLVELKDGRCVPGQIIGQERTALNSVAVAFFDRPSSRGDVGASNLELPQLFSIILVTRELLDSGRWRVIKHAPILVPTSMYPYESLRQQGFIGAKIIGSGIVEEFLNAFYGLMPWDDWKESDYLDRLLVSSDKKPVERIRYKKDFKV